MMRFLRKLFGLHEHKWKEDRRIPVKREFVNTLNPETSVPYYRDVIRVMCHCEICGEPRKFDL